VISLKVRLDGDGAASDFVQRGLERIHLVSPITVAYLSGGMESGKPSVGLIFELPGGKQFVIAETSAALLVQAARAISTKASMEGIEL
jgi:hypothetical protein